VWGLRELVEFDTIITCSVGVGQQVSAAIVAAGGEPRQMFRSDDNLTTQRLIAAGAGASVMPLLAIEPNVPDATVAILKVVDRVVTARQIHLIWHVDRFHPPAVAAFAAIAAAVAADTAAVNEVMFP
jgi:DNA-binding transcriptional LysR family regulator